MIKYQIVRYEIKKQHLEDYILRFMYNNKFYFTKEEEVYDFISEIEYEDILSFLDEEEGGDFGFLPCFFKDINIEEDVLDIEQYLHNKNHIPEDFVFLSENENVIKIINDLPSLEAIDLIKKNHDIVEKRFKGIEY